MVLHESIPVNTFSCRFSAHNTISLSRHEQVSVFNEASVVNYVYVCSFKGTLIQI